SKFWDAEKMAKASAAGLDLIEVSTLASIVDKETNRNDEKATIAGVYLNRLRKGWKLQADPTAVYAFYIQTDSLLNRVYRKHTQIDSPYNTYLHEGLPPGPICIPSVASLLSVLNAQKHDYMFFVARPDGSGYHTFAQTYRQHLNNAREYYRAINQRNKN
ncbi:MAG: endolytic transglycosylase MltG, partial [Bacteroidales bacterium]|nr:endolytic transglycosylase MltG [Bacteroidales bacterium]